MSDTQRTEFPAVPAGVLLACTRAMGLPVVDSSSEVTSSPSSSPASSSDSASILGLSPGKARRISNCMLKPPRVAPHVDKLPPVKELQVHTLLQWHAQSLLDSDLYPPQPQRRRVVGKQVPPARSLLERLAQDASVPSGHVDVGWMQRRLASHFCSNVLAHHTGESVRMCRREMTRMWKDASDTVKANAHHLNCAVGLPGPGDARDLTHGEPTRFFVGALLTWQSRHGRVADRVADMFRMNLTSDQVAEACALDPLMCAEFRSFVDWIRARIDKCGLDLFTCSMEVNSESADKNRLHYHAFVCVHWKKWKQGVTVFQPVEMVPQDWIWQGFKPHAQITRMRGNVNPYRLFVNALYYQSAPKIGTVFREGNCEVFKDSPLSCLVLFHQVSDARARGGVQSGLSVCSHLTYVGQASRHWPVALHAQGHLYHGRLSLTRVWVGRSGSVVWV